MNTSHAFFSLLFLAIFLITKSIIFRIVLKIVINILVRENTKAEIYKLVDISSKKCKFKKFCDFSVKSIDILVVTDKGSSRSVSGQPI
jgi:hypothetical protein